MTWLDNLLELFDDMVSRLFGQQTRKEFREELGLLLTHSDATVLEDGTHHVFCLKCVYGFFGEAASTDVSGPSWTTMRAKGDEICGFCKKTRIRAGEDRVPFGKGLGGEPIWRCWVDSDEILARREKELGVSADIAEAPVG